MTLVFQVWNTQNSMELSLDGPVGQVYALVVNNDMLFAGTQVNLLFSIDYLFVLFRVMLYFFDAVILVSGGVIFFFFSMRLTL